MKPGKRNRKGLDMYQTREKIQSIILLLADLICFAVSYFGGGYLWLVGYRNVSVANMKIELMESFGIVMVVYMLVMLFSDIDNRFIDRSVFQELWAAIKANVGKTQSQGFELTINTTNIRNKDFEWTSDLTFSLYRDKWKERDPKWKPNAYDEYNGWMRYYSGYLSDGLVQVGETIDHMPGALPGQVKIKDIDGYVYESDGSIKVDKHGIPMKTGKPDGKLDDADKVIYGSADPGYLFGFNNTLRWKNFDLNVYFYGQFDKLSAGSYKKQWLSNNVNDLRRGYNQPTSISDLWSSSNPNGTLPGYFQTESAYGVGDYYYEKTWFIRCRNITLGYNIPIKTSKHILSNVRVYFDVNNPFTITPYTGLDPETDISSSESAPSQLQWAYPNVRTYSFGLDITF